MQVIASAFAAIATHAFTTASLQLAPAASAATAAHRAYPRAAKLRGPHKATAAPNDLRSRAIVCLNRLLLEPSECEVDDEDTLVARLEPTDPRTVHVRHKLKAESGQRMRAGIIDAGATDAAVLRWENASDISAMRLELGPATELLKNLEESQRPRLDLLLSMPRPLQFGRLLPMIASMGVGTLWLTGAKRSERSYFSSHLLKEEHAGERRAALIEGLAQSGETALPRFVYRRQLKRLLEEDGIIGSSSSSGPLIKLVCHPERTDAEYGVDGATSAALRVRRLSEIDFPPGSRVVLAIGPERGWEEPEELEMLVDHGFTPVTLGPRTLRTDVAVISLLAVTNDLMSRGDE